MVSFRKVYVDDRSKDFIHPLYVGHFGISFTPNKQHDTQELQDALVLEELHLLVGSFHIFTDLLFQKLIGVLNRGREYCLHFIRLHHGLHQRIFGETGLFFFDDAHSIKSFEMFFLILGSGLFEFLDFIRKGGVNGKKVEFHPPDIEANFI